jgi:hypothetical protein
MGQEAVTMSVRAAIAAAVQTPGGSVSEFCAVAGISRQTYYRVGRRFLEEGAEGLIPRSRRPKTSPNRTPAVVEDDVVLARKQLAEEGWDNGAWSIQQRLGRLGRPAPSVATINRILTRRGLVVAEPRKRPLGPTIRFEYSERNACWQMDGTEWLLADGTKVTAISVLDDHTRRVLHHAAASENADDVWAAFCKALSAFGLPVRVLTDNGVAFNATRRGWVVDLTANLRALGVAPISSSNGHPQTCGKDERNHSTLKRWLAARPLAGDLEEFQEQLTDYDRAFNNRPHQGLGGATPHERWTQAPDPERSADLVAGEPPLTIKTIRVSARGVVFVGKDASVQIGKPYSGETVTVIRRGAQVSILHGKTLITTLTLDPTRHYQPSGKIRGGKRQPHIRST